MQVRKTISPPPGRRKRARWGRAGFCTLTPFPSAPFPPRANGARSRASGRPGVHRVPFLEHQAPSALARRRGEGPRQNTGRRVAVFSRSEGLRGNPPYWRRISGTKPQLARVHNGPIVQGFGNSPSLLENSATGERAFPPQVTERASLPERHRGEGPIPCEMAPRAALPVHARETNMLRKRTCCVPPGKCAALTKHAPHLRYP